MRRTYLGVALITLATLLLELLLTRIFSVTLSYHFAFMVISLALFGLGVSGVVLYLRPERYPEAELAALLSRHSRRFAITIVLALLYVVNQTVGTNADVLQVGRFSWQSFWQLSFLYCVASVPFYYGGMVVSLALYNLRERVATLYFFDLVGASLACVVLDPLLRLLGAENAVLLVAMLAGGAALLFGGELERWKLQRRSIWLVAAVFVLLGANLVHPFVRVGDVKEVRNSRLEFIKWNAFSRIEVQRPPKNPKHPPVLTIDALARTDIFSLKKIDEFKADKGISALVHVVRPRGKMLIIGPGGGIDVLSAIKNGHRDITLAEINPIILNDVMRERYSGYNGNLYGQPYIRANLAEGRNFVRRSGERFDVIQATLVDTWAATATGAFALTENHLYTVEAFEDYLAHLTPGGVVTMSRWTGVWSMEFVRLCSLARAALERIGVRDPGRHVFAASRLPLATLLVKRSPFTGPELRKLHEAAKEREFAVLYSPVGGFNRSPVSIVLSDRDLAGFYRDFPVDLRPVHDERPFFFYAVKPERVVSSLLSRGPVELNSSGTVILVALLGLVTLLVLAAIVIPLWIGKRAALVGRTGSKLRDLLYFVSIGVGFILIEIALLHRFSLHLGHPIHSLRVVLFALLVSSGLGSLLSGRVHDRGRLVWQLGLAGCGVALLMLLYTFLLGPVVHAAIGLGFAVRVLISVALIAPAGLLMGMMLPTGIRLVSGRHAEIVPWAWGLNGAASVFGSVLAMVISIHAGFAVTLMAGGALYLVAVLAGLRRASAAG